MKFPHRQPNSLRNILFALLLVPSVVTAAPKVVVSIKPLELLVRAIASEETQISVLIGPGANPHNFSMKPSQRRSLDEADLVFWIGPPMETFMTRLMAGDEFSARSHAFLATDGQHDEHAGNGHHHHGDHHDHGIEDDPHIWLDPGAALDMAREIHEALGSLPSTDKASLDARLAQFEQSLATTEAQIRQKLEPTRELSLFTYHNAFTHFAEHYELPLAGVLTLNPELSPGARHIAKVQETLRNAKRPCLMTERPFNKDSWTPIIGDISVSFSEWDPLASDIAAGPDGYIAFQNSIADAVLDCL